MGKKIGYSAEDYSKTKTSPFRKDVEKFTIFSLLKNPKGMRILDAGCGEGIYSRELIECGASYVIGVDATTDFIELAKQKNKGYENRIEYHKSFIQDFKGKGDMNAVIGSYILSYPQNLEEAVSYCEAIASHLKKDGKFIGFNNNPFETSNNCGKYTKYGFEKEITGNIEGKEVIYRIPEMKDPIVNFYLNPETYEQAFKEAGFSEFEWKKVLLDPSSKQTEEYWRDFFEEEPPFIGMLAKK